MRARRIITLVLASTFAALPLFAQAGGDRGSGTVPFGSRGYAWQTDQRLEQEELRAFDTDLQRMSRDEWMADALAWVAYDYGTEKRLAVDQSFRVAGLDPGKKAEVEEGDTDPPTWDIAWGKKAPREIDLILTDTEATRVNCKMGTAEKLGRGYIGIFVKEGVILCMARGPFDDAEEGPA